MIIEGKDSFGRKTLAVSGFVAAFKGIPVREQVVAPYNIPMLYFAINSGGIKNENGQIECKIINCTLRKQQTTIRLYNIAKRLQYKDRVFVTGTVTARNTLDKAGDPVTYEELNVDYIGTVQKFKDAKAEKTPEVEKDDFDF